jgi:hypothetical protein
VTGYLWVWPACETVHFIGLSLLVGTVGVLDLRLLGMAKRLPLAPLHRFIRWGIFGFFLNVTTGILFVVGNPFRYIHNLAFIVKMLFVLLAGLNVLVFYLTVFRKAESLGPGDDAPLQAKLIAGVSLFLWVAVMCLGRLITFLDDTF